MTTAIELFSEGGADPLDLADGSPTQVVCRPVLRAAVDRLGCVLAGVWSVDPVRRQLTFADAYGTGSLALFPPAEPRPRPPALADGRGPVTFPLVPPAPPPSHSLAIPDERGPGADRGGNRTIDCSRNLTGTTVERKRVTRHPDLTQPDKYGRSFSHPQLVADLKLRDMISIPLLNSPNFNQVLAVVNLFPGPDSPVRAIADDEYHQHADRLAHRVEAVLRERCERFANRVGIEMSWEAAKPTADRLCGALARIARRAVGCDAVAVFLEHRDVTGVGLRQVPVSPPPRAAVAAAAHQSWAGNRERMAADLDDGSALLAVPMRNPLGQAKGIICCANHRPDDGDARPFTYDDVAVLEAVAAAFVPHLTILLAEQHRLTSLDKMIHEIRVPVVALRAVLERLQKESKANGYVFQYDHFQEIDTYCSILSRQFTELDLSRSFASRIDVHAPRAAGLVASIFAPAKKFIAPLLARNGFTPGQVWYDGLDAARLFVDVDLMTQVVFNLMENAIKYYGPDAGRDKFRLDIVGRWDRADGLRVSFRDWGVGIPSALGERVFEYGYRAPGAYALHVTGNGIGLWLSREIARAHGGDLWLERTADPTEFVLALPAALASRPPAPPKPHGG